MVNALQLPSYWHWLLIAQEQALLDRRVKFFICLIHFAALVLLNNGLTQARSLDLKRLCWFFKGLGVLLFASCAERLVQTGLFVLLFLTVVRVESFTSCYENLRLAVRAQVTGDHEGAQRVVFYLNVLNVVHVYFMRFNYPKTLLQHL